MLEDDILNEIKKNEEEKQGEKQNEIVEIDENEEITNTQYDIPEVVDEGNKKKKEKKPSKWKELPKKTKIIIIVSICVVLLIILIVVLYFLVFKNDEETPSRPEEPMVILEKDNYRYEDGKLIFIDEDKNELGEYECTNKDEELCYVAYYSNEDDFDVDRHVYQSGIPVDFRSDIILDNYVFIYDNTTRKDGNVILYDIKNDSSEEYALVKEVSTDKVIVKDLEDNYGVLTFTEDSIDNLLDFDYDYIGYILESSYLVTANNNNYRLVDLEGEEASSNIPGEIKNFDANNISVEIDGSYYIYNYEGIRQNENEYDYIRFVDSYIIAADNRRLYVFDREVAPMNMTGIRISSNSYNTVITVNDELVQTNIEEAFNVTITDNVMRINYDDEYKDINLNEGLFNKNQEYYSYFEGVLYFYSDAEKTEEIGSYACSYANNVTDSTTHLENCFIARESNIFQEEDDPELGYIPIYNERFVFINDSQTPNTNDNIVMYDLRNSKKLATYKEVDTRYYSNDGVVNFVESAGTIVLAKNTSDSYGLINIGSSNVTGVISFSYKYNEDDTESFTNNSVKTLGNNLLFQISDGTYHLFETNGEEITENIETTNEIVDYKGNYILVKSSDNYLIYNLSGSIVSGEYKYIAMEDTYYITVSDDNKVGVYTYARGNVDLASSLNIYIDGNDYGSELRYGLNGNVLVLTYTYNGSNQVIEINLG